MSLSPKHFLWLLLPVAATFAAAPRITSDQPIINFQLPAFSPTGFRAWLARGSEARPVNGDQFDVRELTLSIFTGTADEKIETLILSPSARVQPTPEIVTGESTIRVINDQLEASGLGWSYSHKDRKIIIRKNVRVVFRAELKDLLQ